MVDRIKGLRQRKADLVTEADELLDKQAGEDGLTEDQDTRYGEIETELKTVNASIEREERLMDERRSMEAVADLSADTVGEADDKLPAAAKKEVEKFASFGEFLQSVATAGMSDDTSGATDRRLIWGAATGAGEAVPSDGGFLVQQDHNTSLLNLMHEGGELMKRVNRIPISANSNGIKLPAIDATSRADGSRFGAVRAFWAAENVSPTAARPKFREMDLRLNKLFGLGYVTDELLADSTALEAVMSQAFIEELTFKAEDSIVNGTGAGQMLGILNSGAVIEIAKESGQAGATVVVANVLNMFARLSRRSVASSVWLINQDILPQLWQMTIGSGTAVTLVYAAPGQGTQAQNNPHGTLMGRPVVPVEFCATLGTAGDIILADLSQYVMIDKGGVQTDSSMHVRFINDEMTFRWITRLDGQPVPTAPLTPFKGTISTSPFLSLALRA